MHWLSRHLVAVLVATISVLSLLTTAEGLGLSGCPGEGRHHSGSPSDEDISPLSDETAILDAEESSPDGRERDVEEEPESKLFAMTQLGRETSTQRAMELLIDVRTRELGSGRSPQTLIFRPPRA